MVVIKVTHNTISLGVSCWTLPTTGGRAVVISRYTEPEPVLVLQRLKINLPEQPPPRITEDGIPKHNDRPLCGADLAPPRPRKSDRLRDC